MSLFNFFRRSKPTVKTENAVDQSVATAEPAITIDRNLFVDDQQPELRDPIKQRVNPIQTFLDKNFEWEGYNDGYAQPDAEYMENKLRHMRSEFRNAVDRSLDLRRGEIGELKLHLIQTSGISSRLEAQLNEKLKQLEIIVHELDTQKILSIEDNGIIAPAVHSYRLGFIKGLTRYQQEKLFAGSTGLFNQ